MAQTIRAEDVLPVNSRVNWGAILAGAVLALGTTFVLNLLAAAIGLGLRGNVSAENLGTGAVVWAVLSLIVALFFGGWATSQLTVGENQTEAMIYGLILWGVVMAVTLGMIGLGIRTGFGAVMGMTTVSQQMTDNMSAEDWQRVARRAGMTQDQIDQWRRKIQETTPESVRQSVEDPETREAIAAATSRVTGWALVGVMLSMASAVVGALAGSGPTIRLLTRKVVVAPV